MKKLILFVLLIAVAGGCITKEEKTANASDAAAVERQQAQYLAAQPIPVFDWSLERDLVRQLYEIRNQKVATHAVWRGEMSVIEGDCPSLGFGLPYDTSLTNPLVATDIDQEGEEHNYQGGALTSVEQPEPNGIFQSKNTSATWVMCVDETGAVAPVYVEAKVTVYPYPVTVDYERNRVVRAGKASASIKVGK